MHVSSCVNTLSKLHDTCIPTATPTRREGRGWLSRHSRRRRFCEEAIRPRTEWRRGATVGRRTSDGEVGAQLRNDSGQVSHTHLSSLVYGVVKLVSSPLLLDHVHQRQRTATFRPQLTAYSACFVDGKAENS